MIEYENIKIGGDSPCFIIAEIAQAHEGSLGMAHAYIDAVSKAGADAIKFQMHIASEESSKEEQWRVKFSYEDDSRYDYWHRMEFTKEQWAGLKKHSEEKGLEFICSPFSLEAVDFLDSIGMRIWKIASGEVGSTYLLDRMIETKKPIILSSGMSYDDELTAAFDYVKKGNVPVGIMQCTSQYPSSPESIGIKKISEFIYKYNCPVGLSDHSGEIYPSLAAVAFGASMVEVHATMSKEMFGPDVMSSVTTSQLKQLVEGVRYTERMVKAPFIKDEVTESMKELRLIFNKSIMAKHDIKSGEKIEMSSLVFVKPALGIPAGRYKEVIGKHAKKDIPARTFITEEMIGD